MRSIVDLVGEAEAKATTIRKDAVLEAREAVANAEKSIAKAKDEQTARERMEMKACVELAEHRGQTTAHALRQEKAQEAAAFAAKAQEKLPLAVASLLEGVLKP